jgi:hypothetical protein
VVVEVLLAEQPVSPHGQAIITGQHDDGVLGLATGVQGVEDATDLGVEVGDHGVVIDEMLPRLVRLARIIGQ